MGADEGLALQAHGRIVVGWTYITFNIYSYFEPLLKCFVCLYSRYMSRDMFNVYKVLNYCHFSFLSFRLTDVSSNIESEPLVQASQSLHRLNEVPQQIITTTVIIVIIILKKEHCNILINKREITSDATGITAPPYIRGIWSIKEYTRHNSRCSFSLCL